MLWLPIFFTMKNDYEMVIFYNSYLNLFLDNTVHTYDPNIELYM